MENNVSLGLPPLEAAYLDRWLLKTPEYHGHFAKNESALVETFNWDEFVAPLAKDNPLELAPTRPSRPPPVVDKMRVSLSESLRTSLGDIAMESQLPRKRTQMLDIEEVRELTQQHAAAFTKRRRRNGSWPVGSQRKGGLTV